jgi:two-component system cell cycle sensor histidine kinase/response regulator CckA
VIHLLVTDVVMPGMRSTQSAEKLTALIPGLNVLFMSGYSESAIHQDTLDGDIPFIQKPFTADSLGSRIREVLESG